MSTFSRSSQNPNVEGEQVTVYPEILARLANLDIDNVVISSENWMRLASLRPEIPPVDGGNGPLGNVDRENQVNVEGVHGEGVHGEGP
jgi:hypothetical protein